MISLDERIESGQRANAARRALLDELIRIEGDETETPHRRRVARNALAHELVSGGGHASHLSTAWMGSRPVVGNHRGGHFLQTLMSETGAMRPEDS